MQRLDWKKDENIHVHLDELDALVWHWIDGTGRCEDHEVGSQGHAPLKSDE